MENPLDASETVQSVMSVPTDHVDKPRWRRFAEVVVSVAVFAVAAPLVVNGFANAVESSGTSTNTASSNADATAPSDTATSDTATSDTATSDTATSDTATSDTASPDTAPPANIAQEIIGSVITEPTVVDTTPAPPAAAAADQSQGHSHGDTTPEQPLTSIERKQLATQLETARATAMKYATVADATAAGYTMVTKYLPLIGAHYIKGALMDSNFDITQPEMLLYDGTNPTSSIVGLSYYMFNNTEPSPFAGPNDHWHQHIGLCIKDGVVVGGERLTSEQCAARGGIKAGLSNGWMVHAWVVPGWDSPQGVFSPEHVGLVANLDRS